MDYGKSINTIKKFKKIRNTDISKKTGFSSGFLSDICNGKANPSLNTLSKIAESLNVSVSYIVETAERYEINKSNNVDNEKNLDQLFEEVKDFDTWNIKDKEELFSFIDKINQIRKARK